MRLLDATTHAFSTTAYEKIVGTWGDGDCCHFTIDDVNDRLIYTGQDGVSFLFNGVADVSIDKASDISFALYKNGSLVVGAETPHSFSAPSKTSTLSICRIKTLNSGDYLEVWAKCSDDTATITINGLNITAWGEF